MNNTTLRKWWNAPHEKKNLLHVLFGKETLQFVITVLIASFLVACMMFIVQMSSVEKEIENTIAFIGVSIISMLGLWRAISNMRKLKEVWEIIVYAFVAVILGYFIFQLSMLLFIGFIIYLVACFFGLANFNLVKELFPGKSLSMENDTPNSSNYGNFYHGTTGDYIQGQNGTDLRITDDLGGGDVRTENGERYHIDDNGFARKV